jgi:hypothetical protein
MQLVDVAAWPLLHLNLQNCSIFKVVRKVKNQYARAISASQCMNLVVLPKTLLLLVGPLRISRRKPHLKRCYNVLVYTFYVYMDACI